VTTTSHSRRAASATLLGIALVALVLFSALAFLDHHTNAASRKPPKAASLTSEGWPSDGQAAFQVDAGGIEATSNQQPVPIASVAKVMTAYLVLKKVPLQTDSDGPSMMVTDHDVSDTAMRKARGESLVPVRAGEMLTERQALTALLLPSANNVAAMLAKWSAGSVDAFVDQMNAQARRLGMTHTTYTDPSGFESSTVSTAADQLRLAQAAMKDEAFAAIVRTPSAELPVAGTVHNTDTLLGTDGFVGIKTGSEDAAGGCFMFRAYRLVDRQAVAVTGVVLAQRTKKNLIDGAEAAARALADDVSIAVPMA
jgi:D-alanyl-D-alanine carboxypeptidase (penicillin-binding protein 5/6)